ncbi:matrixin family metalloprotease [Methanimicrococcus sp. OttesenSCG-928-J09]|nr:matrixin family metalloprotease [Methanimicrococcus sp. OttesenSCG-928-J09]
MKHLIKSLTALVLISVLITPALAYNINYDEQNGWYTDQVNISFDNSSFNNSSWKTAFLTSANTWAAQSSNLNFYTTTAQNISGVNVYYGPVSANSVATEKTFIFNATVNPHYFGYIGRSNVVFNSSCNFTTNQSQANSTCSPSLRLYDVQTIATHELGHSVGLSHSNIATAVMRGTPLPTIFRTLQSDDKNGVKFIYNSWQPPSGSKSVTDYKKGDGLDINVAGSPIGYNEKELIEYSDLIIKGKVIGQTSPKWNTKDGSEPETEELLGPYSIIYYDVVVEVDKTYKGELPKDVDNRIYIRNIGGTIGNITVTSDENKFEKGQEVFLHLKKNSDTITSNYGPQGYYVIGGDYNLDTNVINLGNDVISKMETAT